MIRRILLAAILCFAFYAAANASPLFRGSGVISSSCVYNGSNAGSCVLGSDTTDTLTATDPNFTSTTASLGFASSPPTAIAINGSAQVGFFAACPGGVGNSSGYAANWCFQSPYMKACVTGGVPTSGPFWDEGFVSWPADGNIIYNFRNDGVNFYNSIPVFSPSYTFNDTTASLARGAPQFPALMTGVCGTTTESKFINNIAGDMPSLHVATGTLLSGESVEIKAAPAPMPFWPTNDNIIGAVASSSSPPHDITVNLDSDVMIGYGVVDKGVFDIENNGTVLNGNGAWVYWVQSSNNQACIAWDAGLDITVENINCAVASMGMDRANIRSGVTTFLNDVFEDNGCQTNACNFGANHNLYLGTTDINAGLDVFNATNLADFDAQERGWGLKLRIPNSNITQSIFASRVNNGSSSSHGAGDYPCGGTHSVTFSALEVSEFSHSTSGNHSNFLVQTDEEAGTNTTTVGTGQGPFAQKNCPTRMYLPSAASITGTVTGPNTFTTTTNPATIFPYQVFNLDYGQVWDLGASGLMVNGPAQVFNWTGPVTGVYTVNLDPCFSGEGTLPLVQGVPIYSCFAASSGTVTLYAEAALTVATNTSTTASLTTPANPVAFGINVGDTVFDNHFNANSITSITGTGPYTIALSCPVPDSISGDCLAPSQWQLQTGGSLPSNADILLKSGPIQVTANTTGSGCDGHNILCGLSSNPLGWMLSPGTGVFGTDVAAGCRVGAQIGSIQPVTGSGSGYVNGDHITVAGGTFNTAAVFAVASNSGGVPTSYTVVSGGVYFAFPKTFTQGTTTGTGTGAQLHFPLPQPVTGGSGSNYTVTLSQASGADCITGSTTNVVYQTLTPTIISHDHDLVIWDGITPNGELSSVLAFNGLHAASPLNAFQSAVATNGIYVADSGNGVSWSSSAPGLQLGMTDGGGNVFCNARTDLTTSARCAIPDFTAASFTADITSGVMTAVSGASACKPGMFVWDDQGEFNGGEPGFTIAGTRIVSGGPTSFVLSFLPGGVSTTDVPSGSMNCGWGTPSSAENATIASGGIMTINSGLVGSIHVGDYLTDISGSLPSNVQVTGAIDSTHWQTNYGGGGISAEYMVSVR